MRSSRCSRIIRPTLGGQIGLNLALALHEQGILEKYNVRLLGTSPESIHKAEDRQGFKDCMESIHQPCVTSVVVTSVEDAVEFANSIHYPVIVRPAYTLGGTGGGIAYDEASLREIAARGIYASRVGEILVERCISGWKESEFEVMRDSAGNVIQICSMENPNDELLIKIHNYIINQWLMGNGVWSPDKMLQGRLFSYGDAQRYRLGVNAEQIPVNKPRCPFHAYHREMCIRDRALPYRGNGAP